jgi:hypothetical protein
MVNGTQTGPKARSAVARHSRHKGGSMGILIGLVAGAALGYGYYRLVGCSTGMCPITSNPWIATLYGALVGAVAGMSFTG